MIAKSVDTMSAAEHMAVAAALIKSGQWSAASAHANLATALLTAQSVSQFGVANTVTGVQDRLAECKSEVSS